MDFPFSSLLTSSSCPLSPCRVSIPSCPQKAVEQPRTFLQMGSAVTSFCCKAESKKNPKRSAVFLLFEVFACYVF